MTNYVIVGRKIRVISEGGSVHQITRKQAEDSVLSIIRSKAFAEGGVASLRPETLATLEGMGRALHLAHANGL